MYPSLQLPIYQPIHPPTSPSSRPAWISPLFVPAPLCFGEGRVWECLDRSLTLCSTSWSNGVIVTDAVTAQGAKHMGYGGQSWEAGVREDEKREGAQPSSTSAWWVCNVIIPDKGQYIISVIHYH